ncbi:MAG: hypothetical protein ACPIOQ_07845, partial [Promethearchaeia archaeon]
ANVPAAVRLSDLDLTPLTPAAAAPFRTRARLGVAHNVCIAGAHGSAVQSEQHGRRRADGRYAADGAADGRNAGRLHGRGQCLPLQQWHVLACIVVSP